MKVDLTARAELKTTRHSGLDTEKTVASLARPLAPLSIAVSIPRALETIRNSNLDYYPVVDGNRLVILLSEHVFAKALFALSPDEYEAYRFLPLSVIVNPLLAEASPSRVFMTTTPLSAAFALFDSSPETSVVAVLDSGGMYHGVLCRSDVLASRLRTLAPLRVGGMATPLGVYLTDGIDSGGVGDLGLVLAGMSLTTMFVTASVFCGSLDTFALAHHVDIWGRLTTVFIRIMPSYAATFVDGVRSVVPLLVTMLLLRSVPIAGYHAAEHQTVHCIERGEPLIPEKVSKMPRPHPRCGTNLVSAVTLFGIYFSVCTGLFGAASAIVPAALMTLVTWRQVGTFLQQYVTTRPANKKQLASGIAAGEDLLVKYRENTNRNIKLPMRIWRMGFIQMLMGCGVIWAVVLLASKFIPQLRPYTQGIF